MTAPFFIGRALSIAALEKALASDRKIFVIAQEDPLVEIPGDKDLFEMGTIGLVLQIMRLHNGTIKALFEAHQRGRLVEARMGEPNYTGIVEPVAEIDDETPEMVALSKNVRTELKRYLKDVKKHTEGIEKLSIESDRINSISIKHYLNLGYILRDNSRLEEAELELRKIIRKYPMFADARAALSALLWHKGFFGEAESHWAAGTGLDDRYKQQDWLIHIRRWPSGPTKDLLAFLALERP